MITAAQIKTVASYREKKYRDRDNVFVVEGDKMVKEALLSPFRVRGVYAKEQWLKENDALLSSYKGEIFQIGEKELQRMSSMTTPNSVLCVAEKRKGCEPNASDSLVMALDNISNPGNLGTIIRTAAWFGIRDVVCSENTVDVYNPKVVQSTMGALFSVNVWYTDLKQWLNGQDRNVQIYGTLPRGGKNIYTESLTESGIIVMGNESKGISTEIQSLINRPVTIPSFAHPKAAESLNASIAAAVIMSEFVRR